MHKRNRKEEYQGMTYRMWEGGRWKISDEAISKLEKMRQEEQFKKIAIRGFHRTEAI